MTTHDIEALQIEHDRLSAIMRDKPVENAGTPERLRIIRAHRLLTDLLAVGGGTPEQRAAVMKELTAIHAGERDPGMGEG